MPKKKAVPIIVEEPSYEVECINAARVTDDAQWEYNIKWGGYSEEENSWEPEANLNGCSRMMHDFWQQVGKGIQLPAKDFPVNHKVVPSSLWIELQRESYKKTQAKQKSLKNRHKHAKFKDNNFRSSMMSSSATSSTKDPDKQQSKNYDDDSDEDDLPLSVKTLSKVLPPASEGRVAALRLDNLPASSSKRKREDSTLPPSPTKEVKESVANNLSVANALVPTTTADMDNNSRLPHSTSARDSLFGDSSDSEDIPLAFKPSPLASRPLDSQVTESPGKNRTAETHPSSKPKIPLHQQRKQNPRVKQMALPLDTSLGGISTKNRILLQENAKSTGQGLTKISASVGNTSSSVLPPSPVPMDYTDASPITNTEMDANIWLMENIKSKEELTQSISHPKPVEPSAVSPAIMPLSRIPKRWRWTGELAIGDNESGHAEPVGNVVVTDSTPLDRSVANVTLDGLLPPGIGTVCLRHLYTLSLLSTVLRGFKISQFAIMTAGQSEDENAFDDVVSYMEKQETFSQTALTNSDQEVATMFVFPSTCLHLLDGLSVPVKAHHGKSLIVAIGFRAYTPKERVKAEEYNEDWKKGPTLDLSSEMYSLDCNWARFALGIPDLVFQRLPNKACSIFTTPSDSELPGRDSLTLISLLENTPGCKIMPLSSGDPRFIFIHVSAWDILHKLPGLVDRRLRRGDVQFYTYGSHPSVDRKWWGVHEVFPLGGIVTFTPRAIVEDPVGVGQLIAKLNEHLLWACYVIPPVIPMLHEIAMENGINYTLNSGMEALCSILLPIERGQLDLTWHPPQRVAYDVNVEVDWIADQAYLSQLRGDALICECRKRLQLQEDRSEKGVEAQIVKDLLVMQSELRKEYRRFVIIADTTRPSNSSKAAAGNTSSRRADIKDGFEVTHVKDFVFQDDYFTSSGH